MHTRGTPADGHRSALSLTLTQLSYSIRTVALSSTLKKAARRRGTPGSRCCRRRMPVRWCRPGCVRRRPPQPSTPWVAWHDDPAPDTFADLEKRNESGLRATTACSSPRAITMTSFEHRGQAEGAGPRIPQAPLTRWRHTHARSTTAQRSGARLLAVRRLNWP